MAVSDEVRPARQRARSAATTATDTATLDAVAARILWLAVRMIHEANHVRPNHDGIKVGGHQASSASVVSILTALYFRWLRAGDLVAIKPHASPAYHSLQYLLGNLDGAMLTRLREFGGLQSYPSRTKDPDPVDFSTGSVGLGAVAPMFAALADRYLRLHFRDSIASQPERRFVALVGDAELDEGNVWEAILEEGLGELGNVTMIVDLNRQSLDRVVPGIRIRRVEGMFAAAGWHVIEAKYGRLLQEKFAPAGRRRAARADRRHGERGVPGPHPAARSRAARAPARGRGPRPARRPRAERARRARRRPAGADRGPRRPRPGGARACLPRGRRRTDPADGRSSPTPSRAGGCRSPATASTIPPTSCPTRSSSSGRTSGSTRTTCGPVSRRAPRRPGCRPRGGPSSATTRRADTISPASAPVIAAPDIRIAAATSTQQAFGDTLAALARDPEIGGRIVTAAPDVAVSTNLGGWINRAGVFSTVAGPDRHDVKRPLVWEPGPAGRHIELGISEMNLFLWLSQFGLTGELFGERLVPIGTVYDPFIARGLDALDLRAVRQVPVRAGRHAVGRDPGPGGRRPSVDGDPVARDRAARPARIRAGLRTGGRLVPAGGRSAAASTPTTGSPRTCGSRRGRSTSRWRPRSRNGWASTGGARPCWPAAIG